MTSPEKSSKDRLTVLQKGGSWKLTDQETAGVLGNVSVSQLSMHKALAESTVQFNLKGDENERGNNGERHGQGFNHQGSLLAIRESFGGMVAGMPVGPGSGGSKHQRWGLTAAPLRLLPSGGQ